MRLQKLKAFILFITLSVLPLLSAAVEIECSPKTISVFQGEKIILNLKVKNNLPINLRPTAGFFLSYHLYNAKGSPVQFENRRYYLPVILKKKTTTSFKCPVYFEFPQSGHYLAEFDIVKEGEFWGAKKKWKTARIQLDLKKLVSPIFKGRYLKTFYHSGNPDIDREQYLLRMTFKNCELLKNNKIIGFSPGSNYPQIWIRDTATTIGYAKYYYPIKLLENGVECFLRNQNQSGEIPDWISINGEKDKATVSTDQESSLVIAAYEIALERPLWLRKPIKGRTVSERLEMAVEWVWQKKRDRKFNLISSGLTADWGDVENTYPDNRACKISDRTTLVFSTYTQSLYIQAMNRLADIFSYMKMKEKAKKWKKRSEAISGQTQKRLYAKDRGYYLIHFIPPENKLHPLEKQILAVGGNAEAMLAGLMNRNQIKKFLEVLNQKRKIFNLPNVSFTLIPPYPAGFFPHPALSRPCKYQNGAQWDWIGGRLIKALYLNNFREIADRFLTEIIRKNLQNFNIFEWEDLEGNPGFGSMSYAGAAGVIGEAIMKGYLGCQQNFYEYKINRDRRSYFLKIHKQDQFSISGKEKITINIQNLRTRSICITENSEKKPVCFQHEGRFALDWKN